jgi:GTPase Era involved in 16S rRNA processing
MSKQVLQMKYHPAKKEVSFERFVSEKPVYIRDDSKLRKYMDGKRGAFVLQDHGNSFFEDIVDAFDGEKAVHIDVVTTKNDYADLEQMIEFYNKDGKIEITTNLLCELPDMDATYRAVLEHGKNSVDILKRHRLQFFDIPLNNESVKKWVATFSADVQKEVNSIEEKINSMRNNTVNLCFAGVYSAGKSALINAIIGFRILPESIRSTTARMFRIQSPKQGEAVRIVFCICNEHTELLWNDGSKTFDFGAGPTENSARKAIQKTINEHKNKPQHCQLFEILQTLNSCDQDVIDTDIRLFFPIPLDGERVQFAIYDTPGTDSNYGRHQQVLQDALSKQTHSILVFVAAPNKTEGEGNNALLTYLKEAEEKDTKTSIDLGRSLFVMNWADTIDPDARRELQNDEITYKSGDAFSIKLSDKKLFFTSAKVAYAAKAGVNGIATDDENFLIRQHSITINDEKYGRYYQHNRVATSERATSKLRELCDKALAVAENENDTFEVLRICSGLFALESEITAYGEKYAAAVRAFAIIDSVDKALSTLDKNVKSLEKRNLEDIHSIYRVIEELHKTIAGSIKAAYEKHEYPKNRPKVLNTLKLNKEYLHSEFNENLLAFIDKLLKKWFFGLFGDVEYKEKHKNEIIQRITCVLNDFTEKFLESRQALLEQIRDEFTADVKEVINNNGSISAEAKEFVLSIRPPEIKKPTNISEFGEIYDNRKRADKFLWMDDPHIDKDGFLKDADAKLTAITTSMADDFKKDFQETLQSVLCAIEAEFTQNMEKYSLLMQAKIADKNAMEQLHDKITNAAHDLTSCQEELNKLIWGVKEND